MENRPGKKKERVRSDEKENANENVKCQLNRVEPSNAKSYTHIHTTVEGTEDTSKSVFLQYSKVRRQ